MESKISIVLYLRKQKFQAQVLAAAETKRKNAKVVAKVCQGYYFAIKMLSECILFRIKLMR